MYDFTMVCVDTDSIQFCKKDGSPFSNQEQQVLINELNGLFPEHIKFANDGYYASTVVLKSKNYCLKDEQGKISIKGSALKSSKLEPAIKEFMGLILNALLDSKQDSIVSIYHKYVQEVMNLKDISRWASRKTITEKVLSAERTNELNILTATKGETIQVGDKVYVYMTTHEDPKLKLVKNWNNDHDKAHLLERLYKTLCVFENVIDIKQFMKYHLKNKTVQAALLLIANEEISKSS